MKVLTSVPMKLLSLLPQDREGVMALLLWWTASHGGWPQLCQAPRGTRCALVAIHFCHSQNRSTVLESLQQVRLSMKWLKNVSNLHFSLIIVLLVKLPLGLWHLVTCFRYFEHFSELLHKGGNTISIRWLNSAKQKAEWHIYCRSGKKKSLVHVPPVRNIAFDSFSQLPLSLDHPWKPDKETSTVSARNSKSHQTTLAADYETEMYKMPWIHNFRHSLTCFRYIFSSIVPHVMSR